MAQDDTQHHSPRYLAGDRINKRYLPQADGLLGNMALQMEKAKPGGSVGATHRSRRGAQVTKTQNALHRQSSSCVRASPPKQRASRTIYRILQRRKKNSVTA